MPGMTNASAAASRYLAANPTATYHEIARATGCSTRTARRVREKWKHNRLPDYGCADTIMDISGAKRVDDIAGADIFPNRAKRVEGYEGPKRVLCISDMHCGHSVGLTPPGYWGGEDEALQREMWAWFEDKMRELGPFHACFNLGDNIDGSGRKSGGVELLTRDLIEQVNMATQCLKTIPTIRHVMVYGTAYHVSIDGTDMEKQIAQNVGASISGHEFVNVNGTVFDLKHKIGSSSSPQGRHTALAKAHLWNQLWSLRKGTPKADVFLRGHVHYHMDAGSKCGRPWRAMTLPALQGPGSTYGTRECEGEVHFGVTVFNVDVDGGFDWEVHEFVSETGMPTVRVL